MLLSDDFKNLFAALCSEDAKLKQYSISMIPSENKISPLASLACGSDFHNRYYFDCDILWGQDAFPGGRLIREISSKILIPLLMKYTKAEHINVKPLSGLNCMTMVMLSYCKSDELILTLSTEMGGHYSTYYVAKNLKINCNTIPYIDSYSIDYERFARQLKSEKTKLVYIDQANCLFPLDVQKISKVIKEASPDTFLHVDTSHTNGLIFGQVLENPLDNGADSFGGSTHKTFPGPQKAFFATSNQIIANQFDIISMHMVSNCHTASVMALCIALMEFDQCGGNQYALQIMKNAKTFANALYAEGIVPHAQEKGFTGCHQIWIDPKEFGDPKSAAEFLQKSGVFINVFPSLPGIKDVAFRMGLNEPTRLGMQEDDIAILASVFVSAFKDKNYDNARRKIIELCKTHSKPAYCYDLTTFNSASIFESIY